MNDVMPTSKLNPARLILSLCCLSALAYSSQKEIAEQQLSAVNQKLNHLQASIHQQVNNREQLSQHLASTEKAIGEQVRSLREIQQTIVVKKQIIAKITTELSALKEKLRVQQMTLVTHLRLRYTIDKAHPWAWFLQVEKPNQLSRLMTYYQYLIQYDTKLLRVLRETRLDIEKRQYTLNDELAQLNTLEKKITQQYQTLATNKTQHQKLIQQLTQHIQNKQQQLATTKQDQERLQALLEQLSRAALIPSKTFNAHPANAQTRTLSARFQSPLQGQQRVGKIYNQGILFSAKEGTPVNSILPGKIIFSDWLNGYGLLLIIDHGNGMMSLYAHNESLFKKKGMMVKLGETIATVGHTGGIRENGLYFELRQRGKVIPPRQWLT